MIVSSEHTQSNETQSSPGEDQSNLSSDSSNQELRDAIAELDKMDKFKFQGQEWTPKDLERAILRNKDYTQKTQALAEERKQLESYKNEQRFYENLYYDLSKVKSAFEKGDTSLVNEFLRVYPEKFHEYLKEVVGTNGQQIQQAQNSTKPQYDIETLSRLQKVEKVIFEQEVAKNEAVINSTVKSLSEKYPDAVPEMAIARVYEAHNAGQKVTPQIWEKAFQDVDKFMKDHMKAKYGDMVKKQSEANRKASDVSAGGGTVGQAPQKFKSLKDVTNFAIGDLTKQG